MTIEQEMFLKIMKNAIHPEKAEPLEGDVDWQEVLEIAKHQQVVPIVVSEIGKVSKLRKLDCFREYQGISLLHIIEQVRRTENFLAVYQKLLEAGVQPMVMKGLICRNMYKDLANHRVSTDEDILIRKEELAKVKEVLEKNGYQCERKEISSVQLEEVQEITFDNGETELTLEVHVNPIGHENQIRRKMNEYFTNVHDRRIEEVFYNADKKEVKVATLDWTDHFLFLVFHAYKHFLTSGFGLRQCLDILICAQEYQMQIDWELIRKGLKDMKGISFLADIEWIGNTYLGFELPQIDSPRCPQDMLEDLLMNGIFGNSTQAQRTAQSLTIAKINAEQSTNHSIKSWVQTIFPPKFQMINMHPELLDKPWLLPVRWIQRIYRLLIHQKETEGNLFVESVQISNRRVALLKQYDII